MQCEEYLKALSTSPIDELSPSAAAEHVAICADCNRVTSLVVERERRMAMALGGVASPLQALDTAGMALATARRRLVGRMYKLGLSLLVVATVATLLLRRGVPAQGQNATLITEILTPRCLSASEAAKLITPVLQPSARIVIHDASNEVRVSSTAEDLRRAKLWIDRFDNPAATNCIVPTPGSPKQ